MFKPGNFIKKSEDVINDAFKKTQHEDVKSTKIYIGPCMADIMNQFKNKENKIAQKLLSNNRIKNKYLVKNNINFLELGSSDGKAVLRYFNDKVLTSLAKIEEQKPEDVLYTILRHGPRIPTRLEPKYNTLEERQKAREKSRKDILEDSEAALRLYKYFKIQNNHIKAEDSIRGSILRDYFYGWHGKKASSESSLGKGLQRLFDLDYTDTIEAKYNLEEEYKKMQIELELNTPWDTFKEERIKYYSAREKTSEIEEIVEYVNSILSVDLDKNLDNFKLVKGPLINYYYSWNNISTIRMRTGEEQGGELLNSCMKHNNTNVLMDFYSRNSNVELLVLLDIKGKVKARAVVWTGMDGHKYIDRIYSVDNLSKLLFLAYAKKFEFRSTHSTGSKSTIAVSNECCVKLDYIPLNFKLPYLDSLRYVDLIAKTISRDSTCKNKIQNIHELNTDGFSSLNISNSRKITYIDTIGGKKEPINECDLCNIGKVKGFVTHKSGRTIKVKSKGILYNCLENKSYMDSLRYYKKLSFNTVIHDVYLSLLLNEHGSFEESPKKLHIYSSKDQALKEDVVTISAINQTILKKDAIDLGNGIYTTKSINEFLQNYGVVNDGKTFKIKKVLIESTKFQNNPEEFLQREVINISGNRYILNNNKIKYKDTPVFIIPEVEKKCLPIKTK